MFVHYRTRGFVLKKTDRGESDRIFIVFTKDFGRLELLAKGERKIASKLRGGLELFYLSEIEFIQGKIFKTLTDAVLAEKFSNIRKNLLKLKISHRISEVLDRLVAGEEPDKEIWNLLNEVFDKLNQVPFSTRDCLSIYHYFFWNLVSILGYQPRLNEGVIGDKKINPDTAKMLKLILKRDLPPLLRVKLELRHQTQLDNISKSYFNYITNQLK